MYRCECDNCKIDLLQNEKECQCCHEIDGCIEALKNDIVIQEVNGVSQYIKLHPGFNSVCLAATNHCTWLDQSTERCTERSM